MSTTTPTTRTAGVFVKGDEVTVAARAYNPLLPASQNRIPVRTGIVRYRMCSVGDYYLIDFPNGQEGVASGSMMTLHTEAA